MIGKFEVLTVIMLISNYYVCLGEKIPRIAVVGGGIGGASAVHFLEELFGKDGALIDVFEAHNVGGRLATITMEDHEFEVGGSVIHPSNKYMTDFVKLLGLEKKQGESSRFGLFDGQKFVFAEDSNWKLVNMMKLMWRYGYGTISLHNYIEDMLTKFERIYSLQASGNTYSTITEMLNDMSPDFVTNLQVSTKDGFKQMGFSDRIIDELIRATLVVNYGQSTDVQKFVGAVSVAGTSGGLWGVHGGNRLVPKRLLENSKATLINAEVTNITLQPNSDFLIQFSDFVKENYSLYDIVILATPLAQNTLSELEFINFPVKFSFPGQYHQTICTIVSGTLNQTYFGSNEQIEEIFSLNNTFFSSVGKVYPVDDRSQSDKALDTWKIFSHYPLTKEEVNILFTSTKDVKVKKWLAYPHYSSKPRADTFVLYKNLYHVNAIEWAASAMEMSAIGGKNVALLAFNNWKGKKPGYEAKSGKEEL